eukprot:TRINITY_DN15194_c0_g1_i1.p1 TRINITY_DN15194_c0_g1~~TRINITY_DN15194_c0_g1_i1.p1  ORF type:complete len:791 (-),score=144.45 TRINITY_DN15194_c0_g1_i1:30-2402(-)
MNSPPTASEADYAFADDDFASDDEEFVVTFRLPEEEGDAKRRTCKAKLSSCCRCFWCWKLPIVFLPLTTVFGINVILISIFLGLYYSNHTEVILAAVALHWWTLALIIAIDAAIVARLLVGIVYIIVEIAFSDSARIFYYINDLGWPIACVIEGGLCLLARTIWLSGTLDNVKKALDIIFIMIMVLAAARILQILLVKFIISIMNSQRFWEQVAESLFRQRVLLKLLAAEQSVFDRLRSDRSSSSSSDPDRDDQKSQGDKKQKKASISSDQIDLSPPISPRILKPQVQDARFQVARERLGSLVSFKKIRQLYRNHRTQMHLFDELPKNEDAIKLARMKHAEIRQAAPGSSAYRISAEAKIDGNLIFEGLDIDKKGYVVAEDLQGFFKREEKRKKAFKMLQLPPFDKSKISRKEVVKAVSEVYKEREKLVASLRDRQSVAGVLSKIVGFILILICVIIFVTLLGVDWQSLIAPVGTTALAISFVFGSAASSAFKSFIFLVFVNPYDIGDRVTTSGMTVKVAKISLLSTTFFTPDGKKVIMSNAVLADNTIINQTRSRDVSLSIEFDVDASTPSMKIALLKDSVAKWLKINRLDWDTDLGFWIAGITDRRSITISLWVTLLNTNWSQVGLWLDRKSDLLCFLKETLDGLEIKCYTSFTKIFGENPRLLASERDSDDEDRMRRDLIDEDVASDTHSRISQLRKETLSPSSASDFVDAKRRNTRLLKQALDAVKLVNPKSPSAGYTTPPKTSPTPSQVSSPDQVGSGIKERKKKKSAPKIEITPVDEDEKQKAK